MRPDQCVPINAFRGLVGCIFAMRSELADAAFDHLFTPRFNKHPVSRLGPIIEDRTLDSRVHE